MRLSYQRQREVGLLARNSHRMATAAVDLDALTAFRSVGLFDVLSSTTARALVARPCQDGNIKAA
jgi:hypothetical protein